MDLSLGRLRLANFYYAQERYDAAIEVLKEVYDGLERRALNYKKMRREILELPDKEEGFTLVDSKRSSQFSTPEKSRSRHSTPERSVHSTPERNKHSMKFTLGESSEHPPEESSIKEPLMSTFQKCLWQQVNLFFSFLFGWHRSPIEVMK